jgi:UDP-GlcNAc:undecaprenyl-phosphate GlcNAc-1-phosphate transferase
VRSFLIVGGVAFAVAYLATPIVRRAAMRLGVVDVPDDRKVHHEPTPLLGGVALFIALLAGVAVAAVLPEFRELFRESSEVVAVVVAAIVLLVVGVIDDVRGLSVGTRVAGQILSAGILVLGGVQLFYFWLPGVGILSLSTDLSTLITIIWTLALINAVNLVDGLDGLSVGVTTIAAAAFFVYAHRAAGGQATTAELLTAIVVGAGLGFLRHNFHPARIFMGDAGAYLLGLLLASATVSGISRTTEPQFIDVAGFIVPALLPVLVLAIPLADVSIAIIRRVAGRRPVFHADKQHIHHWLLDMARSHRQAVLVMYLWSSLLAAATMALALGPGVVWRWVSGGIAVVMVASIVALPRWFRRSSATAAPSPSAADYDVPR